LKYFNGLKLVSYFNIKPQAIVILLLHPYSSITKQQAITTNLNNKKMNSIQLLSCILIVIITTSLLLPTFITSSTITNGWTNQCTTPSQWTTALANPVNTTDQFGNQLAQRIPAVCDSPWQAYDGRCYMFSGHSSSLLGTANAQLYHADAVFACKTIGASLASIFSPRENCFLHNSISAGTNAAGCNSYTKTCWVGFYQSAGGVYAFEWAPSQDDIIASTTFIFDPIPTRNGGGTPWDTVASGSGCDAFYDSTNCVLNSCCNSCEPKNVGTGAGGENCGQFTTTANGWGLDGCTKFKKNYACVRAARCPPGYERTKPYTASPVRVTQGLGSSNVCKALVPDLGTSRGYNPGVCTQCMPGKWHAQASFADALTVCTDCDAGRFGYAGATSSQCDGPCQPGYYCPKGTGFQQMIPCAAGTYNSLFGQPSVDSCLQVNAGYYSLAHASAPSLCNGGRCGFPGADTANCQDTCPPGYFCTAGTGCFNLTVVPDKLPQPCGAKNLFAPAGSASCQTAPAGWYTQGATDITRSSKIICPAGYYCPGDGDQYICPNGTYRAGTGGQSLGDCLPCQAGYFCPAGSTTPTAQYCGLPNQIYPPAVYYCPQGTINRLLCPDGNYTIDDTGPDNIRSGCLHCTSNDLCVNGTRRTRLQWDSDSCTDMLVQENRVNASLPRTLLAIKDSSLVGYVVSYSLVGVTNPCVSDSNAGIFAVNSTTGALYLTRTSYPTWLNYESCGLTFPKYLLQVQATAALSGQPSATLTCTITLTVTDANDNPYFLPEENNALVAYRGFTELSDINTAVIKCSALNPCPGVTNQVTQAVEIKAFDEDYSSKDGAGLRYTFVPGKGDFISPDSANPFRINACTGLITAQYDKQIKYANTPVIAPGVRAYNYTVRVTDDGNGGDFPKLSADFPVLIYIFQIPKPPVLPLPSSISLSVYENQPSGTVIFGLPITALDENIPPGTIYYRLLQTLDYVAFSMDSIAPYNIKTSDIGANTIDFESTKTDYRIEIEASICAFTSSAPCPASTVKQTYTVTVLNTNDPPVFVDPYPFYLLENSPDGSYVCVGNSGVCTGANAGHVTTSDPDSATDPLDKTTYSLVNNGYGIFSIDPISGVINTTMGSMSKLDFENSTFADPDGTGRGIHIIVKATSSGNSFNTSISRTQEYVIFLVDQNEAPIFSVGALPTFFVLESAPVGSRVDLLSGSSDMVQATDPDNAVTVLRGSIVLPQTLTYSRQLATSNLTLADTGSLFSVISTSSGAYIQVNSLVVYKTAPIGGNVCGSGLAGNTRCYLIRIQVQDNGGPISQSSFVDVSVVVINTNSGPQFDTDAVSVTISEASDAASVVAVIPSQINHVTSDDATSYVFAMVGGTGTGQFNVTSLPGTTGFQVYKKAGVQLDFEASIHSYSLTISVRDTGTSKYIGRGCGLINNQPGGCGTDATCIISSDPNPAITTYGAYRCFENCQNGVVAKQYKYFCDYTLAPGGRPASSQSADTTLRVDISVDDANDPPYIIDSLGGIPLSGQCSLFGNVVWQTQDSDQTPIAQVFVQDQDTKANQFPASPYVFYATDPTAAIWQSFSIDSTTGAIKRLIANNPPPFNITSYWNGSISVHDNNSTCAKCSTPMPYLSTSCNVTITAISNNHPPKFPSDGFYVFTVLEGQAGLLASTLVPNITAVDSDINDHITFDMATNSFFAINATTSAFSLILGLDYESPAIAGNGFKSEPIVRVRDLLGLEDVQKITVYVLDLNEAPTWTANSFQAFVNESTSSGTLLSSLNFSDATWQGRIKDPDIYTPEFNQHFFQIIPGTGCDAACPFEFVNGGTQMRVKVPLPSPSVMDFEGGGQTSWTFDLYVVDANNTNLKAKTTLTFSLIDLPEPPTVLSTTASVTEGVAGSTLFDLIGGGIVSDVDASDHPLSGHISCQVSGPGSNLFVIQNGILKVASGQILDYEQVRGFILTLTCTDSSGLSSSGTITVNVFNAPDITITDIQVISGSSYPNLPCDGSTSRVRLFGSNFGLYADAANAVETFTLTYARQANFDTATVYTATNCTRPILSGAVGHYTQLDCDVNKGSGGVSVSFALRVTVIGGGISIDDTASFISSINYDPPTLVTFSTSDSGGVNGFSTGGGGSFTLVGSCLGNTIAAGSPPYAITRDGMSYHTNTDHLIEFCNDFNGCRTILSGCTATLQSSSTISCSNSMLPGIGTNFKWRVKVGGRFSNQLTNGAYGPPVISSSNFPISGPSAVALDTSGAFPFSLDLFGQNLGPFNSAPSYIAFVYEHPPGGSEQYRSYFLLKGCTVTLANVRITCTSSDPGVGNSLMVKVIIGGQANSFPSFPGLAKFLPPVFTQISGQGADEASTIGGQLVTITGQQFGPPCGVSGTDPSAGAVNCIYVATSYTRGSLRSVFPYDQLIYVPTLCAVISQTVITCATVPGTGRDHVWSLNVASQNSIVQSGVSKTNYATPVVASYAGAGAVNGITDGNQIVLVSGGDFGPVNGANVTAKYGGAANKVEFTAVGCYVSIAHTQITCTTAPGAGKDLSWVVTVDGQDGTNEKTDYGKPILSGTTFSLPYLNNDGGETIIINGTNFGPPTFPGPFLNWVRFGPVYSPYAYDLRNCIVLSHFAIQCQTPPGSGPALKFSASVKSQETAAQSSWQLSYQPPVIDSIVKTQVRTSGGDRVRVIGKGFALCDPQSFVQLQIRPPNGGQVRLVSPSAIYSATSGLLINPPNQNCPLGTVSAQLEFLVPEMGSTDPSRYFDVAVKVNSGTLGQAFLTPTESRVYYDAPVLDSVYVQATATAGTVEVTLNGLNFCGSEVCCQTIFNENPVAPGNIVSHAHASITFTATGTGAVKVRCGPNGENVTQSITFSSNSPYVTGTIPALGSQTFRTDGTQTIEVWGLYFGDNFPAVKIGTDDCNVTCWNVPGQCGQVPCTGVVDPNNNNNVIRPYTQLTSYPTNCFRLKCTLPQGTGSAHPLKVIRDGSSESKPTDTRYEFLDYSPPSFTSASGTALTVQQPSAGGGTLIIVGDNFGQYVGTVWLGGRDPTGGDFTDALNCTVSTWTHTQIQCTVPPGEGQNLVISVVQVLVV